MHLSFVIDCGIYLCSLQLYDVFVDKLNDVSIFVFPLIKGLVLCRRKLCIGRSFSKRVVSILTVFLTNGLEQTVFSCVPLTLVLSDLGC